MPKEKQRIRNHGWPTAPAIVAQPQKRIWLDANADVASAMGLEIGVDDDFEKMCAIEEPS